MKPVKMQTFFGVVMGVVILVLGTLSFIVAQSTTASLMRDYLHMAVFSEVDYLTKQLENNEPVVLSPDYLSGYTLGDDKNSIVAFVKDSTVLSATNPQTVGQSYSEAYGFAVDLSAASTSANSSRVKDASGDAYYLYVTQIGDIYLLTALSEDYAYSSVGPLKAMLIGSYAFIFIVLFVTLLILFNKKFRKSVDGINLSLKKITEGDLEEQVNVTSSTEFVELSHGVNDMVQSLKAAIARAEAAAAIEKELSIAREIQLSAMPHQIQSKIQERGRFSLYADIRTAKEVGGDFYDYFAIGDRHLGFVIADVSGKGVPAAMFMMKAKTLIRQYMEQSTSLSAAFTSINEVLCQDNDAEMFVTVFAGILDCDTHELTYINAGHNPSAFMREGEVQWLSKRSGPLVGMIEGLEYRELSMNLEPHDLLFMYTDGITEAANEARQMFGTQRLASVLQDTAHRSLHDVSETMYESVCTFEGGQPRGDDITMLLLRIEGKGEEGL